VRTGLHGGTSATDADRAELKQDKETLRALCPDYDVRRHDAFVYRYIKEQEQAALMAWCKARGLDCKFG
jgi:hypothetical protein